MSLTELSNLLNNILRNNKDKTTAFNEQSIAGKDVLTSVNTTIPVNSRIAVIKDNTLQTIDELENEINFDTPYYKLTNEPGEQFIFRDRERNTLFQGATGEAAASFRVFTSIPSDKLLPSGAVFEIGYGGLESGTLSGVPHTAADDPDNYDKDGIFLHIEEDDHDLRIYKDGEVAKKLEHPDWEIDPRTDPRFDWDAGVHTQIFIRFQPAGSAIMLMRLRDREGLSRLVRVAEIGFTDDILLNIQDMPVSAAMSTSSTANNVEWGMSGLGFFNRTSGQPPFRGNSETIRDPAVADATIGSAGGTVVRLYRIDPNKVEAIVKFALVEAQSASGDFTAHVRLVHRDFLTFPGGFDPDDNSNWIAPGDQRSSETALERANTAPGNITIDTFTDADNQTKTRGTKIVDVYAESGGGQAVGEPAASAQPADLDELHYAALIGKIEGNNDPDYIIPRVEERF